MVNQSNCFISIDFNFVVTVTTPANDRNNSDKNWQKPVFFIDLSVCNLFYVSH